MLPVVKPRYLTTAIHMGIWSMVLLLPYLLSSRNQAAWQATGSFFTLSCLIHMGIFYGNALYLYPRFANRRKWWLYLPLAAGLVIISFHLKYGMLTRWYPQLLPDMAVGRFVNTPSVMVFFVSLVYRRVVDDIDQEKVQKEKLARQLATELKFLRSQISPHFLFNVLTNLVALARKQSDQLEPALIRLSDLMRYMLYDSQARKVTLQQEIAYLNSYIELQKLRFGSDMSITVRIAAPGRVQDYQIEPMLLIPFVENAFKHGMQSDQPAICMKLVVENQVLKFEVQNRFTFQAADHPEEHSGIGLSNVESRLQMLYPDRHRLTISRADGVFSVTLSLPLL